MSLAFENDVVSPFIKKKKGKVLVGPKGEGMPQAYMAKTALYKEETEAEGTQ